jgi:hypothetical protein
MHEREFQRHVIVALRKAGAVVLNKAGTAAEGPGWPDLYIAHHAFQGWLELKVGQNMPSKVQCYRVREFTDVGVPSYLLTRTPTGIHRLHLPTADGVAGVTWRVVDMGFRLDQLLRVLHDAPETAQITSNA